MHNLKNLLQTYYVIIVFFGIIINRRKFLKIEKKDLNFANRIIIKFKLIFYFKYIRF